MKTLLAILSLASLTGCPAISEYQKNYDRTFAVTGNITEQSGLISYEVRKANKPGEGSLGLKVQVEGNLSEGKQVIRLGR